MKKTDFSGIKRLTAGCVCLASIFIAQAQTFGTAMGNDVPIYELSAADINTAAGYDVPDKEKPITQSGVSYRIVDVNNKIWVKYSTHQGMMADAWAVQLRNWGPQGNDKIEMNLNNHAQDAMSAWNIISTSANPANYSFRDGESTVKMQIFCAFTGIPFGYSDLFDYTRQVIANPVDGDNTPPTLLSATATQGETTIDLTLSATDDNEFFYYITDPENQVEEVCFTNTLSIPQGAGITYNFKVIAVDFNGNKSDEKTVSVKTAFDPTLNLAKGKPSYASSGSPQFGNDGNNGTRWESAQNDTEWWYVDLGGAFNLNKIEIMWEGAYAEQCYIQTALELPDDPASDQGWTNALELNRKLTDLNETLSLNQPARYVKFRGVKRALPYGNSFWEFRVYAIGIYDPSAPDVLTSVNIANASVIENEDIQLTVLALTGKNLVAEKALVNVTIDDPLGAEITKNEQGNFIARGLKAGSYTLTATAQEEDIHLSNTATLTVTSARTLTLLSIEAASQTGVAGTPIPLTLTIKDQYGEDFSTNDLQWNTQQGASVENNQFTATKKGDFTLTATCQGITSNEITISIVAEGENLALNKPVTAIEGSENPRNAVDGDYGSMWVMPNQEGTDNIYDAWLTVDLGKEYNIDLIKIEWEGACAGNYTVDYSTDGINFDPVYKKENVTGGAGVNIEHNFYGTPEEARFIRVFSTKAATGWGVKIREVSVYGFTGGTKENIQVSENTSINGNKDYQEIEVTAPQAVIAVAPAVAVTAESVILPVDADGQSAQIELAEGASFTAAQLIVEKIIPATGKWYFMSMPFDLNTENIKVKSTGATAVLEQDIRMLTYNTQARAEGAMENVWQTLTAPTVVPANTGFALQVSSEFAALTTPLQFISSAGIACTGANTETTLTNYASENELDRFVNFLGFPYLSEMGSQSFYVTSGTNCIALYQYDPEQDLYNTRLYTDLSETAVRPYEAIFMQANRADDNLIYNYLRTPVVKAVATPYPRIELTMDGDRTAVVFDENASTDFRINEDGIKLAGMNPVTPVLYLQSTDGKALSVSVEPETERIIKLGIRTGIAGEHTIAPGAATTYEATTIELKDKVTGAQVDLQKGNYTFTAEGTGEQNDRFTLRIVKAPTALSEVGTTGAVVRLDAAGKLTVQGVEAGIRVNIIDMQGRIIGKGISDGNTLTFPTGTGFYLVQIGENVVKVMR